MRLFSFLLFAAALVVSSWWLWNNNPQVRELVEHYIENGEIITLEARYTADQIMDANRKNLLSDDSKNFKDPELKFHPYLMMYVKYTQPDRSTREGVILWSMVDGEMVIDTQNWEKTHGFEDAILAGADQSDYRILNMLAKSKGKMTIDQLQKELHVETDTLTPWLESLRAKHLIVLKGTDVQLHFQNPKILVLPETKFKQWLVTKPYNHAQRVANKYSKSQIERNAKAAFGPDFMVKSSSEVYLPVYSIEVQNPDGSVLTSFWNALNGRRITPKYFANDNS